MEWMTYESFIANYVGTEYETTEPVGVFPIPMEQVLAATGMSKKRADEIREGAYYQQLLRTDYGDGWVDDVTGKDFEFHREPGGKYCFRYGQLERLLVAKDLEAATVTGTVAVVIPRGYFQETEWEAIKNLRHAQRLAGRRSRELEIMAKHINWIRLGKAEPEDVPEFQRYIRWRDRTKELETIIRRIQLDVATYEGLLPE